MMCDGYYQMSQPDMHLVFMDLKIAYDRISKDILSKFLKKKICWKSDLSDLHM